MKDSIREYRPKSFVLSKDSLMSKDGVEADLVNPRIQLASANLQQFSLITKFTGTYNSSNSR